MGHGLYNTIMGVMCNVSKTHRFYNTVNVYIAHTVGLFKKFRWYFKKGTNIHLRIVD